MDAVILADTVIRAISSLWDFISKSKKNKKISDDFLTDLEERVRQFDLAYQLEKNKNDSQLNKLNEEIKQLKLKHLFDVDDDLTVDLSNIAQIDVHPEHDDFMMITYKKPLKEEVSWGLIQGSNYKYHVYEYPITREQGKKIKAKLKEIGN